MKIEYDKTYKKPSQLIFVRMGDLRDSSAEVLVNSVGPELNGCPDGVVGSLIGPDGPMKIDASGTIVPGQVVVYVLQSGDRRAWMHAVGQHWDQRHSDRDGELVIYDNYRLALDRLLGRTERSIAFPLLGTGGHGYPIEVSASASIQAFAEFLKEHPRSSDLIEIVVRDEHSKEIVEHEIETLRRDERAGETRFHPVFGLMDWDGDSWWGRVLIDGWSVRCGVAGHDTSDSTIDSRVAHLHAMNTAEVFVRVADRYLDLLNSEWKPREEDYSHAEFVAEMSLQSVFIEEDDSFNLWLDVGDLFAGHQLVVFFCPEGNVSDIHLL